MNLHRLKKYLIEANMSTSCSKGNTVARIPIIPNILVSDEVCFEITINKSKAHPLCARKRRFKI